MPNLIIITSLFVVCPNIFVMAAELEVEQQIQQEEQRLREERRLEKEIEEQDTIKRIIKKNNTIQSPKKPQTETNNNQNKCFDIKKINIENSSILTKSQKQELIKPYLQRCLTIATINLLLKKVTAFYVSKGFITSKAGLKIGSNLTEGTLTIYIQEGKLNKINLDYYPNKASNNTKKRAFPLLKGDLLSIYAIEQGLEQINQARSLQAKMAVKPATKSGYSDIDVQIKKINKPYYVSLATNNNESETTGKYPATLGLYLEDLAHAGDKLTLRHQDNSTNSEYADKRNHSRSFSLNLAVPSGWWNWDYSLSKTSYEQHKTGSSIQEFALSGDSITHTLNIARVMLRSKKHKLSFSSALSTYETNNYINDALIPVSSRKLLNTSSELNYLHYFATTYLNAKLIYGKGIKGHNTTDDENTTKATALKQHTLYKLIAIYAGKLATKKPVKFSTKLTYQTATSELLSTQHCIVGGRGSVGGFKNNSVSEEKCLILNAKLYGNPLTWLSVPTNNFTKPITIGIYADYGVGESYYQGEPTTLSGGGVYLQYNTDYVEFMYDYGQTLNQPSLFDDENIYPNQDKNTTYVSLKLKYSF